MARQINNGDEFGAKAQKSVEKADLSAKDLNFGVKSQSIQNSRQETQDMPENLEIGYIKNGGIEQQQKLDDYAENFGNFDNFASFETVKIEKHDEILNGTKSFGFEKMAAKVPSFGIKTEQFDEFEVESTNFAEFGDKNEQIDEFDAASNSTFPDFGAKTDNFDDFDAKNSSFPEFDAKMQIFDEFGTKSSKSSNCNEFSSFSDFQDVSSGQVAPQMSALRPDGSFDMYDAEKSEKSEKTEKFEKFDASPRSRSLASSSRRQSTEDSIDTDDEYFCYEMRQLEELERNSHMVSLLSHSCSATAAPEFLEYSETPDSEVHRLYQLVLDELVRVVRVTPPISVRAARLEKSKTKIIESPVVSDDETKENANILDTSTRRTSGTNAINTKKSSKMAAADSEDIYDDDLPEHAAFLETPTHRPSKKSPKTVRSHADDISDPELDFSDHSENSEISGSGHVSHSENDENDVTDNSGDTSGPDSCPEPEVEEIAPTEVAPPTSDAQPVNDAQASKWRLLKTLKERKIEDQSNAEKQKEEEAKDKEKEKVLNSFAKINEMLLNKMKPSGKNSNRKHFLN